MLGGFDSEEFVDTLEGALETEALNLDPAAESEAEAAELEKATGRCNLERSGP